MIYNLVDLAAVANHRVATHLLTRTNNLKKRILNLLLRRKRNQKSMESPLMAFPRFYLFSNKNLFFLFKEDHDDSKSDKSDVTESSKKEEKKETDEATEVI